MQTSEGPRHCQQRRPTRPFHRPSSAATKFQAARLCESGLSISYWFCFQHDQRCPLSHTPTLSRGGCTGRGYQGSLRIKGEQGGFADLVIGALAVVARPACVVAAGRFSGAPRGLPRHVQHLPPYTPLAVSIMANPSCKFQEQKLHRLKADATAHFLPLDGSR